MPGTIRWLVFLLALSAMGSVYAQSTGAGGEYISSDACAECHTGHALQINHHRHGQQADPDTPFAAQGCETCHGAGETHVVNILEDDNTMGDMILFGGERPSIDRTAERHVHRLSQGRHVHALGCEYP